MAVNILPTFKHPDDSWLALNEANELSNVHYWMDLVNGGHTPYSASLYWGGSNCEVTECGVTFIDPIDQNVMELQLEALNAMATSDDPMDRNYHDACHEAVCRQFMAGY